MSENIAIMRGIEMSDMNPTPPYATPVDSDDPPGLDYADYVSGAVGTVGEVVAGYLSNVKVDGGVSFSHRMYVGLIIAVQVVFFLICIVGSISTARKLWKRSTNKGVGDFCKCASLPVAVVLCTLVGLSDSIHAIKKD